MRIRESARHPRRVLVTLTGKMLPGFGTVLLFKPPFGPYPPELAETFPVGQSEIPAWDRDMVAAGCAGIRAMRESHPGVPFTVLCQPEWAELVRAELPGTEVRCEPL